MRICSVDGCNNKHDAKGFCRNHYRKLKIYGDPLYVYKRSEQHRTNLSKSQKGKKLSEEHKKKISEGGKGKKRKPYTQEHKAKISKAHTGKKLSEEHKKKISEGGKGKKRSEEFKVKARARKHSQATRDKISKSQKGKKLSEEHKAKMRKAGILFKKGDKPWNTGKQHPQATRDKISKSQKGKKHSEEHKKKTSLTLKGTKPWNTGKKLSKEHIAKITAFNNTSERKQLQRQIRSKQKFPRYDTAPEKLLQELCSTAGIGFYKQKNFNLGFQNHPVDLFIEPNICLEADGDWPHANPKPFTLRGRSQHPGYKVNDIIRNASKSRKKPLLAKDIWKKDAKITQALEQQGNTVLRFWQSELETEPEKCIKKIIKAIK